MKSLTILFLKFLLLYNFAMAETIPTKSKILKQSSDCFKDSRTQLCKELVSEIEKLIYSILPMIHKTIKIANIGSIINFTIN